MCLCLLFNEVDLVFIEMIVGYITLVNASSMRWNLVLLDKVPRVDRMPNKVQYFTEKNASVVMKGYLLSWNKYWIKSNLFFFFFFSSYGICWNCTKSNRNYFSEENIKTTTDLLFFWQNERESVGGRTLTNVQNLFFSSNFGLCFLSDFTGECCCQYVQHLLVIFGDPLIILALCFQSLPFQTCI